MARLSLRRFFRPQQFRVNTGDPKTLTTISDAEVPPRDVGLRTQDIDAIWKATIDYYNTGLQPAIGVCVRRHGQIVMERMVGYARGNAPIDPPDAEKVLATPDTLFNMFSASKAVTAMLVHLLNERGLIHLDDPVAEYIPEFARYGKEQITVRHVLTHRTGLLGFPTDKESSLNVLTNPEDLLEIICDARPVAPAGRQLAYGALGGGFILGEIVARVTGKGIRELLDETVCKPLGFEAFNYGLKPDQFDRVTEEAFTGPEPIPPFEQLMIRGIGLPFREAVEAANDPRFRTAVVPAGNIYGTTREITLFFEMLMRGGILNGTRVFPERIIRRAIAEQSYHEVDRVIGLPIRYSMGFMLGSKRLSFYGPSTERAFGHLGFTNILSYADPDRDITVAFMTNGKALNTLDHLLWLNVPRTIAQRIPQYSTR